MNTRKLAIPGALAIAMTGPAALMMAAPAQAAGTATVSVFHGVPNTPVDVYANGKALLKNFKPGTLTDPVKLPAATYDLKVTAVGAGADGKAVVQAKGVKVPADANITVVAHLTADSKPALTPYVNDTTKIEPGKARLTVRHDAAAPPVDVRSNGDVVFGGLTNPDEADAVLPPGDLKADVALAGTDTVAIGPADVPLVEGKNTIVYAWGSAADKNLKLAVQTVSGMHSSPSGVPSGTGGAATSQADRWMMAGGVAAGAGGLVLLASRRRKIATV